MKRTNAPDFLLLIVFSFLTFCSFESIAQQNFCQTTLTQEQVDYFNATRAARESMLDHARTSTIYIPIKAHIIRRSDGTGGLSLADLNTAMSTVNDHYSSMNIEFVPCGGINYVNDDGYFFSSMSSSLSPSSDEYTLANANKVADAINVFFLPDLNACGWATFPVYSTVYNKDWIFMNNNCVLNGSTFSHELGHYFNLYHTHQGPSTTLDVWDYEYVDGSNCGPNIGDELCDTPADPVLSGLVSSSCVYTGFAVDPQGDLYTPDVTNIMSYSQKACRTYFSPMQQDRIVSSYYFDRGYLTCGAASCDVPVSPVQTGSTFTSISLSWDDMGADEYEVFLSTGTGGPWFSESTGTNSITMEELACDETYNWRVRSVCGTTYSDWTPTNTAETGEAPEPTISQAGSELCASPDDAAYTYEWFKDGSAFGAIPASCVSITDFTAVYRVQIDYSALCSEQSENFTPEASGIDDLALVTLTIAPNPASTTITVQASDFRSLNNYSLFSLDGQLLKTVPVNASTVSIDVSDLAKGVYLLRGEGESVSKGKLVVVE